MFQIARRIINYITTTPNNTNKAVLKTLLREVDTFSATSIKVAPTITGQPGTAAQVVNIGTDSEVLLQFTIPRGDKGEKGDSPTIEINNEGNWVIDKVDTGKSSYGELATEEEVNDLFN